jgi:hypothetical protein
MVLVWIVAVTGLPPESDRFFLVTSRICVKVQVIFIISGALEAAADPGKRYQLNPAAGKP